MRLTRRSSRASGPRPRAGRSPPGAHGEYAVVTIGRAAASVPRLVFRQVPEGKTVTNRLHLDLAAADWEAEIGRLTDLVGTRIRDVQENGARWITLADAEGSEFDLVRG
jgi:hypothetical protein